MKIAIGSDHGGFSLKEAIKEYIKTLDNTEVADKGCFDLNSVNYPDFAKKVGEAVSKGECDKGILICGTGIGISIAANKIKGIRAALCHDHLTAYLAAEHNNANILCMGGRTTGIETAKDMVKVWLETKFAGGRHKTRIDLITKLEESN
jgi:ribose 5-phosphate isomerase B